MNNKPRYKYYKSDTLVVTATYNEAQNIERLIRSTFAQRKGIDMLVIDDNSPDGTGEIVSSLIPHFPGLTLISRGGKLGYGSAFVSGFLWGIAKKNYRYFISMDADLSHDPSYIKQMLNEAKLNDVVIGSRYTKGGGTRNWGLHRRILSVSANIYSRIILGIPVKDCTSGFRCYNRAILEKISLESIQSGGYSFLEELIYFCALNKCSFKEIPIIFTDRELGRSKISRKEIIKAIIKVPALRLKYKK